MLKYVLVCLVAGLVLSSAPYRADARSDTAVHGYARPADRACFQESWGSMLNTCSTTREIFVPASIDSHCISGSSWKVSAQSSSSSSNVCCRAIGQWTDGRISAGAFTCMSQFGAAGQTFSVSGPPVWADRAFFVCDVGPNAKLMGVDWDPNGDC